MNIRLLATAVAAALMGLSTVSFGQNAGNSAGAEGATRGQDNPGANETSGAGVPLTGPAAVTPGSSAAGAGSTDAACDSMTGAQRDRCLRDQSRGSNSGAYTPQRPSTAKDKNDPEHPNVKSADQERSRSQ
jgi:hypothetical protein